MLPETRLAEPRRCRDRLCGDHARPDVFHRIGAHNGVIPPLVWNRGGAPLCRPKTSSRSTSPRINNIPVDLLWWVTREDKASNVVTFGRTLKNQREFLVGTTWSRQGLGGKNMTFGSLSLSWFVGCELTANRCEAAKFDRKLPKSFDECELEHLRKSIRLQN
jgi:hypothetical protein